MKLCITTATTEPPAKLDSRFGRSPFLAFVDTETDAVEFEENRLADGPSGVGSQVAQLICERGAHAVISGQIGPSAFAVLKAAGVPAYTTSAATLAEAIELFREGALTAAAAATGPGHHGGGGHT